MSTVERLRTDLPEDAKREIERHTWLDFAGVLLILVGIFNIIHGISAISDSSYLNDHVLFSNLHAWGWFHLFSGIVQIFAGYFVMKGAGWAAVIGIASAFVNAITQLSSADTFVFWSLTIVVTDVLVIYGIVKYGGARGRTR
jgi:uncharacterized membrane protein